MKRTIFTLMIFLILTTLMASASFSIATGQKMRVTLAILLFAITSQLSEANVGVFTGYGHSIELTSTDQIQMVREEVTIIPGRGRFQFSGSVPGMDRVEYDCRFELKNLGEDSATIQVGFPLNSQFLSPPYDQDQKVEDQLT